VNTKVRNQAGRLVVLRTIGTHERKALTAWVADKAADAGELRLLDRLPGLATGEAHVWSPACLKVSRTVRIALRATFDSSATPAFWA